jgi:hypothetical protein
MKWIYAFVFAPLFSTLAGCIDGPEASKDSAETGILDTDPTVTDTDTTADTDTTTDDLSPMWDDNVDLEAAITCGDNTFELVTYTVNWGYDAELYMGDTKFSPPWEEAGHMMVETDVSADPNGYSEFSITLDLVDTIGAVTPGESTLFGCDDLVAGAENFSVTFALAVRDDAGEIADCVVFGHDAAGLIAGSVEDLSAPAWVNSDCRVGM